MKVYIGGAIDCNSFEEAKDGFAEIAEQVIKADPDSVVYNPLTAFINASITDECQYIVDINKFALDNSDLAVFVWSDVPSFGTPIEIQRCSDEGIDMIILNKAKKLGVYIKNAIKTTSGEATIVHELASLESAIKRYRSEIE